MNLETKYKAAITKLRELGIGKIDLPGNEILNLIEEEKSIRELDKPIFVVYEPKEKEV